MHTLNASPHGRFSRVRCERPTGALSGLALAAIALLPITGYAQSSASESRVQTLDTMVVTGQALAIQRSVEAKAKADIIVDSVSADDIGKLPDHNTAAALRRIPGVAVQEDQGEARWPIIRGLNSTYNRTTLNGAIVASPDYQGTRNVPLDVVPATLAKRLEVKKTVTPDMDHNALGGTINIVTRSAFDYDGPFFAATGAWADYAVTGNVRPDDPSYRGNAVAGTTFGAEGQFGIIVSGNFQRRDSDIPQIEGGSTLLEYNDAGQSVGVGNGNGYLVAPQRRLFWYHNIRERSGGNAILEWRPSDTVRAEIGFAYNEITDDEQREENRLEQIGDVSNQTSTTGTYAAGRNIIGLGRFQIDRSTWGINSRLEWDITPDLHWNTQFAWSSAEAHNPESTESFVTPSTVGFSYDVSGFYPQFTPTDPAFVAEPSNYNFSSRSTLLRESTEDVYDFKSDLSFASALGGFEVTYKAGVVLRRTERDFDQNSTSYSYTGATPYTLADAYLPGSDYIFQGGYRFDPRIDSDGALAYFAANSGSFTGNANNVIPDYVVTEDISAAYVMATLKRAQWTIIPGVRVEHAKVESDFYRQNAGVITPASDSGSDTQLLPGINASYRFTDRLVLRGAATKTFGRPNFNSLAGRETVSFNNTIPTVSRGNPDLKPRESLNLDLSLEYYLANGIVSVAVFSKDIENEIFTRTTEQMLDVGRGLETVTVTRPENAEDAQIRGIEIGYQHTFTFLPAPFDGLGVSANSTWLDTEFRTPTATGSRITGFFQQPDRTSNATLFFAQGGFDARVSYNYIGQFIDTISSSPDRDQYWARREQIDLHTSYTFAKHYTVFVEVENLTETGRRELYGPDTDKLQEDAHYGRVVWAGLTAKF